MCFNKLVQSRVRTAKRFLGDFTCLEAGKCTKRSEQETDMFSRLYMWPVFSPRRAQQFKKRVYEKKCDGKVNKGRVYIDHKARLPQKFMVDTYARQRMY